MIRGVTVTLGIRLLDSGGVSGVFGSDLGEESGAVGRGGAWGRSSEVAYLGQMGCCELGSLYIYIAMQSLLVESKRLTLACPGIPKVMAKSQTLKTEVVSSKPHEIVFKLQQEYTPRLLHISKAVNSLVTLTLDEQESAVS